ncbi:MAG: GIY-YIG nuclease family protein [Magnetospirillum sp.]|nr:GIY-YIG nuclease family protein [Magnetospirillum sp.]
MAAPYAVYMVASVSSVLYVGVTNDLARRVSEHRSGAVDGFSRRYHCHRLVWYETFDDVRLAIAREKEIKGWRRVKKDALVRNANSAWRDLWEDLNR